MSKIKLWMKSHKKITIAVSVVLIAFLILNCVWGIYHYMVFGGYEKITKDDRFSGAKISKRNDITYSISSTTYLGFGGNLSISDSENKCFLIIWPSLFGEPEIGFTAARNNFYIDRDGNLARDYDDISKKIYEENREAALAMLNNYNEWTKAAENKDKTFFN